MKRARSLEDFAANPVGRFDVGATHLVWCQSPTLCGSAHWGQPTEKDAGDLARRIDIAKQLAPQFDVIMDARAMETFDWSAVSVLADFVKSRLDLWSRCVRHHAVIVPAGVVGVFVAGLMPLVGVKHPVRFFASIDEAIVWMENSEAPKALEEANRLIEDARGVPAVVRSLRDYLSGALGQATVESAAQSLGLSARSLQRELRRHDTQFTGELVRARVHAACALLAYSDEKVESIAVKVGCCSSSQLSAMLRRAIGASPAEYRGRYQRA